MHSDSGKAGRGPFGVMNIGSVFKGQGPRPNPELSRLSIANVSRETIQTRGVDLPRPNPLTMSSSEIPWSLSSLYRI